MRATSSEFKAKARAAIADQRLQTALKFFEYGLSARRLEAAQALPEFETLRDQGRDIKNHVLNHLDYYLERFEAKVHETGGQVHWCRTAAEARETVLEICRGVDAKTCTKGKSMITEEIALNPFLAANGVEPIETDLGEYIIQLADEPPGHIIGPALHKTRDQIADLFHDHHKQYGRETRHSEPAALVNEAREILRQKYIDADVGITGANFLIAETGSTVIVTNEGNGDLTQLLPKAHVVVSSIEKVVPTLEDATTILRLLARSATGQEMSVYTTFSTGPRRETDLDGPPAFHVVLLDNGRSKLLGSEMREVLRCIRCGACMNHCPVYRAVGGHTYGWVYPGPIGAVLDPHFVGLEEARHLPNASTFCGACENVCPMRIPLPKLLRNWRTRAHQARLNPQSERLGLAAWGWLVRRPALYRLAVRPAIGLLAAIGRRRGRFRSLPLAGGWTGARDMPAPQGGTFIDQWRKREGRQ